MAVNPELSSSLALIIQGHHLPHRYTHKKHTSEHLKIYMYNHFSSDRCSFVQQGPDVEGGPEYPQDVGLSALSAQCPVSGGF